MDTQHLQPRIIRAPDFGPGEWLNVERPLTPERLRGRTVLVDFWDYTCINCLRTLPYVVAWHRRYARFGLVVVGVHSPEFHFGRARMQVEQAIETHGIRYPVLLDNDYQTWDRYANRAWPTKYLIDADGYLRFHVQGEGRYGEMEHAIQEALRLHNPEAAFPPIMEPLRPEDAPGAVCYRTTPELYAGYQRGSLGNTQGYAASGPVVYELPPPDDREEPFFYADGIWRAGPESLAFAGQEIGRIVLPYHAAGVNVVFSPSADPAEVALHLRPADVEPRVEVLLDGAPVAPDNAGEDILYDDGGISYVLVDKPRLYEVIRSEQVAHHELELLFRAHGLALYSFTFTSCVAAG